MKKLMTVLLILALCIGAALPALADVIYEPINDFYSQHRSECKAEDHGYVVAAAGASAAKKPGGKAQVTLDAGETVWPSHVYTDGEGVRFGLVTCRDNGGWTELWVDLTGMAQLYNASDFCRDHGGQFTHPETPPVLDLTTTAARFWDYPGAAAPLTVYDTFLDTEPDDENQVVITTTFEDEQGLLWGELGDAFGYWIKYWRGCWVCLSAPEADELTARETPAPAEPKPTETPSGRNDPPAEESGGFPWLPAGLVAAVVVAAAVLLACFRRKK